VVHASSRHTDTQQATGRRGLLAGLAVALTAGLSAREARADPRSAPFLKQAGGKGFLADEEAALFQLRQEKEGAARALLVKEEELIEEEVKSQETREGRFCATPFGVDVVGITEAVLLVGALVGGIVARQRKQEMERLNEQLRKINMSLRQQARSGTVYAPGLTYAPPLDVAPPRPLNALPSMDGQQSSVATLSPPTAASLVGFQNQPCAISISMEEDEMTPDQIQCREALRQGKRLLKERNGAGALVRFEKSLMLSKALADRVMERRAMRGLAAAARLQGQFRSAIKHLERVLEISREMKEFTGDSDAFGTIADCYTDMGDLEKAAFFYDKYIDAMNKPNN